MNRTSSRLSQITRLSAAFVATLGVLATAHAQTVKAPPPVVAPAPAAAPVTPLDNQWHGGISIGGAAASGNASSFVLSGAADGVKATAQDKISLWGIANYGTSKNNGVKTANSDSLRLGGRYDYNLTQRVFAFGTAEGETNKVAGLRSRIGADVGAGYHIVQTPDTSFDVYAVSVRRTCATRTAPRPAALNSCLASNPRIG
ncbi:DUF481 domain-containing protein [Variovorax sp. dw_308]|uniref:DUF481 domain-containing protein n=1 Tax=Variovorax sp. dw_308 TaxID=2721546 RepID=UPI00210E771A|nr:DUF481 domain-containing protein [Variovorax sp. dw_308]